MKKSVLVAGLFVALLCTAVGTTGPAPELQSEEMFTLSLAQELDDYYRQRGVNTSAKVIWQVAEECQKTAPVFFPDGQITPGHLLAIAALESDFYPKAVGIFGEKGLFQILRPKEALQALGIPNADPFDIRVNVMMGAHVLREKYARYKDVTKAIIAYNGVVKRRDGTWDDQYLVRFQKKYAVVSQAVRRARDG